MNIVIRILIVIGAIFLFVISYTFNHLTKRPKGDYELPENCRNCNSEICHAKNGLTVEDIKKEIEKCAKEKENEQ